MGIVFCLNKTLFTHFDYTYARIKCFSMTQNRKLLISSSKMRDFILKKREESLYLNPNLSHLRINVNLKLSGLYSSLFVKRFSLIFQKKLAVGENRKEPFSNNTNDDVHRKMLSIL